MKQEEDAPEFVVQLVFPRELDAGGHPLAEVVEYEDEFAGVDPRRIAVVFEGVERVSARLDALSSILGALAPFWRHVHTRALAWYDSPGRVEECAHGREGRAEAAKDRAA